MGFMKLSRLATLSAVVVTGALALSGCVLTQPEPPAETPGDGNETVTTGLVPLNFEVGGVTFTSEGVIESDARPELAAPPETDAIDVGVVFDPMCPHCAQFEGQYGETINALVDSGEITLTTYPVAFVAGQLSMESANAFYAVASFAPEAAQEFQTALLAANMQQGGLDGDALIELAASLGAEDDRITKAITEGAFNSTIQEMTDAMLGQEIPGTGVTVSGTPTVFAEGVELQPDTFAGTPEEALETLQSQL